jgi:SAM-dependent methyltransferase
MNSCHVCWQQQALQNPAYRPTGAFEQVFTTRYIMALLAPQLFDATLLRKRLARAYQLGYADFLVARAKDDLSERLQAVLRPFVQRTDWGTPTGEHAFTDLENVPFEPQSFDLITSLLALHTVNDLPGTLIQLRQALKPDGLFMGCLLGGNSLTELRQAFLLAESEGEGGISPHVAPHIDVREMGGLLQRAGFQLPVTDVDTVCVRYASTLALMHDLRRMGWTNALNARSKRFLKRDVLLKACAHYAEKFSDSDGRIRATFELVWFSGWAAHESQQKPLKPGSAKTRLADVLKSLPDTSLSEP